MWAAVLINYLSEYDKNMKVADYWEYNSDSDRIVCTLCPWTCRLNDGSAGVCGVRVRNGEKLYSLNYGRPAALAVDPIEKKPLYHFLPGTDIFSLGTYGCNLSCSFCQNWHLSRGSDSDSLPDHSPESIIQMTKQHACPSVAFTYNEPVIFAEYVRDIARIARQEQIRTVVVSNGYVSPAVRETLFENIDAANIDLKSFDPNFYRHETGGRLEAVLDTLRFLVERDIHVEITTLLIDGLNTDDDLLKREFEWIASNLSPLVPLHLSAFHPAGDMMDRQATRPQTLINARVLANEAGLPYVYLGNVAGIDNDTRCRNCNRVLIRRTGYAAIAVEGQGCECGVDNNIYLN